MGPQGVIDTFRDFQRFTKVLIWVSLALGVAVFAVCLVADLSGAEWMKTHVYIPNILAGFTGFLIGVPFALVVFATFASQRDEKAAADRVNAVSQIAWDQYREAIVTLCNPIRLEKLRRCAKRIQDIHDETWQGFNRLVGDESPEAFRQLIAFAQKQSEQWYDEYQTMTHQIGEFSDLRLQWFAAVRDWNTLDQYVRLQRLERGLPWFHRELDSLLQERMVSDRHPMLPFFEIHGVWGLYDDARTMFGAIERVKTLSKFGVSRPTFDRLMGNTDLFPTTRVDGYLYTTEEVAHRMGMLYAFVQQIDRSGWPIHAPENPPLAS